MFKMNTTAVSMILLLSERKINFPNEELQLLFEIVDNVDVSTLKLDKAYRLWFLGRPCCRHFTRVTSMTQGNVQNVTV